ncbi:interferon alpha/beta receptor 1a-like [Megalops cyprinoides]|uniref:interferon alpha/beta receptor 1a-like n=1 Tax=Megalops cyprinoides TaxID=118141 RepID=UPI0018650D20|nr:interferon alpha/beta receptor 1a-like [Megalops cyprinoides]
MNSIFMFVLVTPLAILICLCEVLAILPSPQNVTLQTQNTQYILRWDWDKQAIGNETVTFTAQYIPKYKLSKKKKTWISVCDRTLDIQCDFTNSGLHYQGIYVLQVQASCGREHSEWVPREFCPEKDAELGPPSKVEVTAVKGLLQIWISDPLTSSNTSMKDTLVPDLYYLIQFWKQSGWSSPNVRLDSNVLKTSTNEVTLSELEPWTTYCLRVRSHDDFWNRTSHFSPTQCLKATGVMPLWLILLLLCLVGVLLSYATFRTFRVFKSTFFPSLQLPASIHEYFWDSPCSDQPRLLTPESETEVCYEKLHVCPKVILPEIHAPPDPPGPEADTSGHSSDSGVYSTEEGSGQLGGPSPACSAQAPEQRKMADVRTDSGIGRMGTVPADDCWP